MDRIAYKMINLVSKVDLDLSLRCNLCEHTFRFNMR